MTKLTHEQIAEILAASRVLARDPSPAQPREYKAALKGLLNLFDQIDSATVTDEMINAGAEAVEAQLGSDDNMPEDLARAVLKAALHHVAGIERGDKP